MTNHLEHKPAMRAVPMGKGIIDYDPFIGRLKEIGTQGYIVYELCKVLQGGGPTENSTRGPAHF